MNQKEIALSYAKQGIAVFPCSIEKEKAPLTWHGMNDATLAPSQISLWWDKHPNALIGAPNRKFIVLDVDNYNMCEGGKALLDMVIKRLDEEGIFDPKSPHSNTMSGGNHYFFRREEGIGRKQGIITYIDLLGKGGYTILPDQKNYICDNREKPWENLFQTLPKIDMEGIWAVAEEMKGVSASLKVLKDANKQKKKSTPTTKKRHSKPKEEKHVTYQDVVQEHKDDDMVLGHVDNDRDEIKFKINKKIYTRSTKDVVKLDPAIDHSDEFPMRFPAGSLTDEVLLNLFYNQSVQIQCAKYLGVEVPPVGGKGGDGPKGTLLMHSLLPGHVDENKSMGVRWDDKNRLNLRDYANYFGDTNHKNVDYNIVRLFAVIRYKTNVPRLKGPEFTIWWCRLMEESGVITVDHLKKPFNGSLAALTDKQRHMALSFQYLDALKSLHENYNGETTFAQKFSSAWCDISPSTVNRYKKSLVENKIIKVTGTYDCSGGKRTDGFFETKLYSMPPQPDKNKSPIWRKSCETERSSEYSTREGGGQDREEGRSEVSQSGDHCDAGDRREVLRDSREFCERPFHRERAPP